MKKPLKIILIFILIFSFSACAKAPLNTQPTGNPSKIVGLEENVGADTTGQIGFFDPNRDYTQNPKYKFAYLRIKNGPIYEGYAKAFKIWTDKLNIDFEVVDTNDDTDLFLTSIETLARQGFDGIITDPDTSAYVAVDAKCKEVGIAYMPAAALPYDENGSLLHPHVGYDYYMIGQKIGEWLVKYQKEVWPDAKPEEIGVMGVDYSAVPEISCRLDGAMEVITQTYPDMYDRYFYADTIVGTFNSPTAYSVTGPIFSTNPQIKYWLIAAAIDDFGDGSVIAAKDAGLEGKVVAASMNGPSLIAQWDAGVESDYKAAVTSLDAIRAEPIICGLLALVEGDATPESLWAPEWVNKSINAKYAQLIMPTMTIERDTYQQSLMWVNEYIGQKVYDYPVTVSKDFFTPHLNPPSSYAG